jgi:hypothetical protein
MKAALNDENTLPLIPFIQHADSLSDVLLGNQISPQIKITDRRSSQCVNKRNELIQLLEWKRLQLARCVQTGSVRQFFKNTKLTCFNQATAYIKDRKDRVQSANGWTSIMISCTIGRRLTIDSTLNT